MNSGATRLPVRGPRNMRYSGETLRSTGMDYQNYLGKSEQRTDTVWPLLARGLAAALDVPDPSGAAGAASCPLYGIGRCSRTGHRHMHWVLTATRGGAASCRRCTICRAACGQAAGSCFPARCASATRVSRTSTITAIDEKSGGSGRLVFVTVRHEIAADGGPAIVEEQDIVYRGIDGSAVKPAAACAAAAT